MNRFDVETVNLPRQARDKHIGKAEKEWRFWRTG
jgi:hypothetical protein